MTEPKDDKLAERRRKLVKHLSALVRDIKEPVEKKALVKQLSGILATSDAVVGRDLEALAAGELPPPAVAEDPTVQLSVRQLGIAKSIREARTAAQIDDCQRELSAGVLEDVDDKAAKTSHQILMGRRYFLAQTNAQQLAALQALLENAIAEEGHGKKCPRLAAGYHDAPCTCWLSHVPAPEKIVSRDVPFTTLLGGDAV